MNPMETTAAELPDRGEIVLCTVREITPHGIYVDLDEYNNMNGFLHISEITTGWVRNIERVAKVQQKLVLKVIRAEKSRREVDLSLRQVTNEEKRTSHSVSTDSGWFVSLRWCPASGKGLPLFWTSLPL